MPYYGRNLAGKHRYAVVSVCAVRALTLKSYCPCRPARPDLSVAPSVFRETSRISVVILPAALALLRWRSQTGELEWELSMGTSSLYEGWFSKLALGVRMIALTTAFCGVFSRPSAANRFSMAAPSRRSPVRQHAAMIVKIPNIIAKEVTLRDFYGTVRTYTDR